MRGAAEIDRRIADGNDPGRMCGVPVGVKDFEEEVEGFRTTAGSALLASRPISRFDTPHVARLRAEGAVIIGRTASAEFAMASDTSTAAYGTTRNPWRPELTSGGSSGGSASAVAAGFLPLATGSDSGGSMRSPASHCGLVGLKPTFGRIPQPVAGSTLNAVGALVKTVADAALHLDVASGPHGADRFSLPSEGGSYLERIERTDLAGARAAISFDLGYNPVDPAILDIVRPAVAHLVRVANLSQARTRVFFTNVYLAYCLTALEELRQTLTLDHASDLSLLTPALANALARHLELLAHLFQRAAVRTGRFRDHPRNDGASSPGRRAFPGDDRGERRDGLRRRKLPDVG